MSLPIQLELPPRFLEREIRCGYEVSEKQKKIWAVELDRLKKLLDVCKKHDIKVQVFAGTLLGAIRHKGFIPWDDDVDVALSRPEFEKLCKVAAEEFYEPYFFQTALTDRKFFCPYARLRNSLTTGIISGMATAEYNNGIYIDVFVLDGMTDSWLKSRIQRCLLLFGVKCCTMYYAERRKDSSMKERLARLFRPIVRLAPYQSWVSLYNHFVAMYDKSSARIGLRTHFSMGERYWVRREYTLETASLPFENIVVPVPREWHRVLSDIYGDYMVFPPVEQRGCWHEGQIAFDPDVSYRNKL